MLQSLKIENIAIIEQAEFELKNGFNVLTGETGAGKSIIIDSINAILGDRTSRELIRTGATSARVSALFSETGYAVCDALEEMGIPAPEDGCLLVQRLIKADGKNNCRINGEPVTVAMLKNIGKNLINIHGQHDNQALLSREKHVGYLDALAGNADLLSAYEQAYTKLNSLIKELENTSTDEEEKARRLEIIGFQVDELESADIQPGEGGICIRTARRFSRHSMRHITPSTVTMRTSARFSEPRTRQEHYRLPVTIMRMRRILPKRCLPCPTIYRNTQQIYAT